MMWHLRRWRFRVLVAGLLCLDGILGVGCYLAVGALIATAVTPAVDPSALITLTIGCAGLAISLALLTSVTRAVIRFSRPGARRLGTEATLGRLAARIAIALLGITVIPAPANASPAAGATPTGAALTPGTLTPTSGAGLDSTASGISHGGSATGPAAVTTGHPVSTAPNPGWSSTDASQPAPEIALVSTPGDAAPPRHVVVRRGDCLWDIVARHLGPDAGDVDVAQEWPRWYAANRDVIGDDPNLIRPGLVLSAPADDRSDR